MSRKDYTKRDRTVPTPDPPQPDHVPTPDAEPLARGEATGGAMTGETGVLSPAGEPDGFVPAERREIEDPRHAGVAGPRANQNASGLMGRQGQGSMGFGATPSAGTEAGAGAATELSELDGGYGAEEGLSETDPAYREASHLPASDSGDEEQS